MIRVRLNKKKYDESQYVEGSALIGVIAALVLFSVLAAALLPMVSSSGRQAVMSDKAEPAVSFPDGHRIQCPDKFILLDRMLIIKMKSPVYAVRITEHT